ncbi:hypothetical protein, partial [Actinomadura rubrisoli]
MRGHEDEGRTVAGRPARRPPGGKALARLVQQLAGVGLVGEAQATAAQALPEADEATVRRLVAGAAGLAEDDLGGADEERLERLGAE